MCIGKVRNEVVYLPAQTAFKHYQVHIHQRFCHRFEKIKNVYISQIHEGTFSYFNFERLTLIKF